MSKSGGQKLVIRFPPTSKAEPSPSPAPSADASALTEPEVEATDVDGNDYGDDNASIDIDEDSEPTTYLPTKRGRGRPRGSLTRGSLGRAGSGTPTPRARGRGRGRGRGRSRGRGTSLITIKLPKKDDGEDDDETEGDGVGEEAEETNIDTEEDNAKKVPTGGGKPFRRIQGQVYIIEGDEFITESDPKGDEKIDKFGNLLGGRRFKATTFLLPNRHPERQYMLAIDAARTSGFRDSLYYFRRNPLAFKLNATQPEKDYLISEGKLGPHLKTRSVTLITARSAFKLHGSKMIVDGRWVTDDYFEDKALAAIAELGIKPGDPVGEPVDPNAEAEGRPDKTSKSIINDRDYSVSGGGSMYRPGGPTTIFAGHGFGPFYEPLNPVRKALLNRDGVSEENWMWMMASRVREADERWKKCRSGAINGAGVKPGARISPEAKANVANSTWDVSVDLTAPGTSTSTQMSRSLKGKGKERADPDLDMETGVPDEIAASVKKKRKVTFGPGVGGPTLPLGVYEPHTGTVFFRSDTQPTQSRLEQVTVNPSPNNNNDAPDRGILGGTKTGANAWGLAYVDTYMDLSSREERERILARSRERILKVVGLQHLTAVDGDIVGNSGKNDSVDTRLDATEEDIQAMDVT